MGWCDGNDGIEIAWLFALHRQLRSDFAHYITTNFNIGDTTVGTIDNKTFDDYLKSLSSNKDSLQVFVTPTTLKPTSLESSALGWAPTPGDYAILSVLENNLKGGYVMAHEIGHALGAGHASLIPKMVHRLMNSNLTRVDGLHTDSKRFGESDLRSFSGKYYKLSSP